MSKRPATRPDVAFNSLTRSSTTRSHASSCHISSRSIERLDEREFRLVGRQVERVVALNDVTTPEALSYIDHQLKRLGVTKMLAKSGARQGDVVWIAGFSFEYHEDL